MKLKTFLFQLSLSQLVIVLLILYHFLQCGEASIIDKPHPVNLSVFLEAAAYSRPFHTTNKRLVLQPIYKFFAAYGHTCLWLLVKC